MFDDLGAQKITKVKVCVCVVVVCAARFCHRNQNLKFKKKISFRIEILNVMYKSKTIFIFV